MPCPVQVGGGLRDADSVAAVLGVGVERAVIGTAALRDPEFLDEMVARHGDRIVVSVDARGGKVALAGWTEVSEKSAVDAVAELTARGARRFLCTTIEVDGTMEGPAIEELTADRRRDRCRGDRLGRGRRRSPISRRWRRACRPTSPA